MINATWHRKHPMPKPATMDQRIRWHLAHARACGCREIPKTVVAELRSRGLAVPRQATGRTRQKP
jgi:hypothetical protein